MKEIQLTQGMVALIDDEDFEKVSQYNWSLVTGRNTYYAEQKKRVKFRHLHRFIMNTPADMQVDHKDGNGLNCQKYNMRNCTATENSQNQVHRKPNKTGYTGVHCRAKNKYYSCIRYKTILYHLGVFNTAEKAAVAYNTKAKELYGEYAKQNIILGG